jgi:transcriptional regulator with XRE-family HTH domain
MEMHKEVCSKMRMLRLQRGWSQENVAEMLNMSLTGYANIERGLTDLSLSKVEEIAKVFDMTPQEFLNVGNTVYNIHNNGNGTGQGIGRFEGTFNISCTDDEKLKTMLDGIQGFMGDVIKRVETLEKKQGEKK